jgi:hypothetical protein
MNPNILTHTIHSSYICDGSDVTNISTALRATDTLWLYYYSTFRIQNDDHLLYLVHRFFNDIPGMEPFFYYMMSKRLLVDEMIAITTTYLSTLRAVIVIAHMIDGWEDFFLRSDYTLFADEENELESYRIKIYHVLHLLVPFLGEDVHELHPYYKTRLCDYFLIRIGESIVVEEVVGEVEEAAEEVGEDEEDEDEDEEEDEEENDIQ